MKTLKKITCAVLALTMVIGLTACSSKGFDHKKMVEFSEDQDFDEMDDSDEYVKEYGVLTAGRSKSDGIYISCTGSDAQDVYDTVLNRFGDFKSYDVDEATSLFYANKEGYCMAFVFTLEDPKDAEKLFKKYSKRFADDGEEEKGKGYTYVIDSGNGTKDRESFCGVYLKSNTVIIIRAMTSDSDTIDELCKKYNIISPTEA